MTSVTQKGIRGSKTTIEVVNPKSSPDALQSNLDPESITLKQYHPDFLAVTGQSPSHSLILSSATTSRNSFFCNACAYLPEPDELYLTSDLLQSTSSSHLPVILISKVTLHRSANSSVTAVEWQKLRPPSSMQMPAGGCYHKSGIMFCSQGTLAANSGGLFFMPRGKPLVPMVTNFGGRPFNSPQRAAIAKDGSLWFTDTCHGFETDIRPRPTMPDQVWRFDPDGGSLRVMEDGLKRPGGICFSPDGETVYICDADPTKVDGRANVSRAATIYAFDITMRSQQPFLVNRRTFAVPLRGVPRAVQCDLRGNVYAACGDGVEIWSAGAVMLGVIEISGGCSNLCFGKGGELFVCADQRLWRVQLEKIEEAQADFLTGLTARS